MASETAEPVDETNQEEALSANPTLAETEDSVASDDVPVSPNDHPAAESKGRNFQDEPSGESEAKIDERTEHGEVPPQEAPTDGSLDPRARPGIRSRKRS